MRTKEIEKKQVSIFKKIRKKVFLSLLNKKRAIQGKIPNYLKNDIEVLEKFVNILQKPETMRELENFIDSNPLAINLLENDYLNSYLYHHKEYVKPGIKFLPYEKQKELLLGEVEYQNKFGIYRVINGKRELELEHEKTKGKNDTFQNCLELFSPDVILQAYIENEKKGEKKLDEFKIEKLPQELQLKIGLLNNKYIEKMSIDAQIAFVNNNPYLMSKLGKDAISVLLQSNPQLEQFIHTRPETKNKKNSDVEDIKKSFVSRENFFDTIKEIDINQIRDIELFKFYPNLLEGFYNTGISNLIGNHILQLMITNISKHTNQSSLADFFKQFYNEFDYNPYESEKYRKIEEMMIRGIKITSNDDILEIIDAEELTEYIKNPNKEKLLEIIGKTYGNQARRILEDRPNIDIDKIQNFYIFSPKAIEEFSIGAIHHLLSYDYLKSPMIISELVRYPEKMDLYKKFDSMTKDYFGKTPIDMEEKLKTFFNFYDLIKSLGREELTKESKYNLLQYIDDISREIPINPIHIEDLNELKCYDSIRKEKFEEAIKKTTDIVEVKNLICKQFLGISYNERFSIDEKGLKHIPLTGMLNFYNVDTFINDSRTLNSGMFETDELDLIELLSIIDKINDLDVLKKVAENLSSTPDIVINPVYFKTVRDKIPMQYSKELIKELLTPEKAKAMAEEGIDGISYIEDDGFTIIKLTGANFLLYIHNMHLYMSNNGRDSISDDYKKWTELEEGVSTISGIIINQESIQRLANSGNVGFFKVNPNQILGMGADDINVTHSIRSQNSDFTKIQYDYPEILIKKSQERSSSHNYAEIAIARRNQNVEEIEPGTFGGKIMPDYVCGKIKDEKQLKNFAKQMRTNIIIEIDDEVYKNKEYEHINSATIKRKDTDFMKKIKEIMADGGERI